MCVCVNLNIQVFERECVDKIIPQGVLRESVHIFGNIETAK